MQRIGTQSRGSACLTAVIAALAVTGCATLEPESDPIQKEPEPEPEIELEIDVEPPAPIVEAKPPVKKVAPPQLPSVAIVLTSGLPAYADVARELTSRLGNYDVYDLSDGDRPPVSVLRSINDSDSGAVVAIGLRAAQSSVAMANTPVIFSQVFNYQDHHLLIENNRGIAAHAPLDAQLAAWKEIDPTISRIGAIVGEGHDVLITEAELAAERLGIELNVQIAHSDQETLYVFRRMIHDIDGFWLFPDNRILSGRVLEEMLSDANRQHVSVAVPNSSMLEMGAAISISSVASDIADTIVKVIRQIQAGNVEQVPLISRLSQVRVETNDPMLKERVVAKSSNDIQKEAGDR